MSHLLTLASVLFVIAIVAAVAHMSSLAIGVAALAESLFYIFVTASVISWYWHYHSKRA